MGIQGKFATIIGLIVLLVLTNFIAVLWWVVGSRSDGKVINLAGRERMLSQRITKEVLLSLQGHQKAREEVLKTRSLFENSLQWLIDGNPAENLPPAKTSAIAAQLRRVQNTWVRFYTSLDALLNGKPATPQDIEDIYTASMDVLTDMNNAVQLMEENNAQSVLRLRTLSLGFFFVSLLIAIGSFLYIRNNMIRRIQHTESGIAQLAEYDLSAHFACTGRDELSHVCQSAHKLTSGWKMTTGELLTVCADVTNAVSNLWSSFNRNIRDLEVSEQHSQYIASAAIDMTKTSQDIAGSAATAADSSSQAKEAASTALTTMATASECMRDLERGADTLETQLGGLTQGIGQIGSVVRLINEIADQTNLLALNAAIEAARAGEQGRGFAVVASEVRKLAEKTLQATAEIAQTMQEIQGKSRTTVEKMALSRAKTKESSQTLEKVRVALVDILHLSNASSDQIQSIAAVTEQQSVSSQQTAQSIHESVDASARIKHDIHEMLHDCGVLGSSVSQLIGLVGRFHLPANTAIEIDSARISHKNWVQRLYRMHYLNETIRPEEVSDHTACRFGKWYYTTGAHDFRSDPDFISIEHPHKELHQKAKQAVQTAQAGDQKTALTQIEEVDRISRVIVEHLDRLRVRTTTGRKVA